MFATRIDMDPIGRWQRPAYRGFRSFALFLLMASSVTASAEDSTNVSGPSTSTSATIDATVGTLTGPKSAEPPILRVETFNPLAPAITTGPRETLTDFLRRVQEIRTVSTTTLANYLRSDRLFLRRYEKETLGQVRVMAAIAARAMEFDRVPAALESFEYRSRMALMLDDLIERIGQPPIAEIPDGAEMSARKLTRWSLPGTEIDIVRIDEGPRTGEWLFSAETIRRLPEWYNWAAFLPAARPDTENLLAFYKYGPLGVQDVVPLRWMFALPAWTKILLADQPVWRWIGLLVLIVGCASVFMLVRRLCARLRRNSKVGGRQGLSADIAVPVVLALLIVFVREAAAEKLRFTAPVYAPLVLTLSAMFYVTVIWIIWAFGRVIAERTIVSRHLQTWSIDGQLIRLTVRFFALVFCIAVLIEGANRLGLPAYSIVTGLGVGGIAVALAARDSLANLMGSFTIMIEKPFRVGHWVKVGDTEGTVEAVGFRSTRIRTFYDSLVSVPSSKLMNSTIDNMGERSFRRVKTTIAVRYDTPPEQLREFVEAVREIIATHPHTLKESYHVYLQDFADSSLEVLLYFFLTVPDWASELREREDIFFRIMACADNLGVAFAFPTRTVHIAERSSTE